MIAERDRPIGVALLGAGHIAVDQHLPIWAARADAEVSHIIDADPDRARTVAQRWGVANWGADIGAALADPNIVVVDICTPPAAHVGAAVAALDAGRHVLVEKPAALLAVDVGQIAHAARRNGMTALVGENWPYSPVVRKASELIRAGSIGEPTSLQVEHLSGASLDSNRTVGQDPVRGYLLHGGIHAISTSIMLLGDFATVFAVAGADGSDLNHAEGPANASVAARFASGAIGSFLFSGTTQCRHPGSRQMRVIGSEGRIEFDIFTGRVSWTEGDVWTGRGTEHEWRDSTRSAGHAELIDHFLDCVRNDSEPITSAASQLGAHRAYEAMLESLQTGRPVEVGDGGGSA